jgi:hypothetical protein
MVLGAFAFSLRLCDNAKQSLMRRGPTQAHKKVMLPLGFVGVGIGVGIGL